MNTFSSTITLPQRMAVGSTKADSATTGTSPGGFLLIIAPKCTSLKTRYPLHHPVQGDDADQRADGNDHAPEIPRLVPHPSRQQEGSRDHGELAQFHAEVEAGEHGPEFPRREREIAQGVGETHAVNEAEGK